MEGSLGLRERLGLTDAKLDDLAAAASSLPPVGTSGPPAEIRDMLRDPERTTLCGGRFAVAWPKGSAAPWAGKRLTMYCAEPLCITEKVCTGPRFVPHLDQFDRDPDLPGALRRRVKAAEVLAGARACAMKATGRDDDRSDREIGAHIALVWKKMLRHLRRNPGKWGLG